MSEATFTIKPCNAFPSWPWIAEFLRSSCCQLYSLDGTDDTQRKPHHSNEIISEVRRRLGKVDGFSPDKTDLRSVFGILILLEDFAHITRSTYLPRETRILLFSPIYGRIAGGLPLEFSEYADNCVAAAKVETLGRIATVTRNDDELRSDIAVSESYTWGLMTIEARIHTLIAIAGNQAKPDVGNVAFYNPKMARTSYRGQRWQKSPVKGDFGVARGEGSRPCSYYLICKDDQRCSEVWRDITYEDAKRWLVVIDQIAGATHSVKRLDEGSDLVIELPMNAPEFCVKALASAADHIAQEGHMRTFRIPNALSPLVEYILKIAAIKTV